MKSSLHVVTIEGLDKHPNATKLSVCTVSGGEGERVQVVCGAKNARVGLKTILAPVGSTTPQGLLIKKANLRGVDSYGMLCSPKDLNVSDETGVVDLDPSIKTGTELSSLSADQLSSTPWYSMKEVERFYLLPNGKVEVQRKKFSEKVEAQLVSQTFVHEGQTLFRHYPPLAIKS